MRVTQMRQRTKMLSDSDPVQSIHSSRKTYGDRKTRNWE